MNKLRIEKRDVHGWIALDKRTGKTSTEAVTAVRRLFRAKKAGHAGTLDPLASGILPIALGEATKTVPFVMDGLKIYRFTIRWGIETDTDDAEGRVVESSPERPSVKALEAIIPEFTGAIEQTPPRFSALKIGGARAYDLARDGEYFTLAPRTVEVRRLSVVDNPDDDYAVLEAECGRGTYVRALARDLGRKLGCYGHVKELRRTRVGPFEEKNAIPFEVLVDRAELGGEEALLQTLAPVETGLNALPALSVSAMDAQRLALGQPVMLRGRDAPLLEGLVSVSAQGALIALAELDRGSLKPKRIFNLPR